MPLTSAVARLAPTSDHLAAGDGPDMNSADGDGEERRRRAPRSGPRRSWLSPHETGWSPSAHDPAVGRVGDDAEDDRAGGERRDDRVEPGRDDDALQDADERRAPRARRGSRAPGAQPVADAARRTRSSPAIADCGVPSETKLPESVIGVIATATMPTIDALRRIARTLSTVRKFGRERDRDDDRHGDDADDERGRTAAPRARRRAAARRRRRRRARCRGLGHAASLGGRPGA